MTTSKSRKSKSTSLVIDQTMVEDSSGKMKKVKTSGITQKKEKAIGDNLVEVEASGRILVVEEENGGIMEKAEDEKVKKIKANTVKHMAQGHTQQKNAIASFVKSMDQVDIQQKNAGTWHIWWKNTSASMRTSLKGLESSECKML